jgi:hypothetical protein
MRKWALIILTIVLIFCTFFRFKYINPRYDEGGAIQTILSAKYYNESQVYEQMWDAKYKTDSLRLENFKAYSLGILPYIVVPIRWTYAVSIYPLITPFISDLDSLQSIKVKGFIGFSLLNIIGFILLGFLLIKHYNVNIIGYIFVGSIICLGIDYIHYARSATTYAFLTLGIAIQLWSIKNISNIVFTNEKIKIKTFLLSVFAYSSCILLNHQFIVTSPFLLLLLVYLVYKKKIPTFHFILAGSIALFFVLGDIFFLYLRSQVLSLHLNPGQNVLSNGLNGEYVLGNYPGFFGKIKYFIYTGALFIYYSLTGYYNSSYEQLALIVGSCFFVFIIWFVAIRISKTASNLKCSTESSIKDSNRQLLYYYIFSNFFIFLILIILHKLNLSPTRHSLFFSILFCILVAILSDTFSKTLRYSFFACCFLLLSFSTFTNVAGEYKKSFFDEKMLFDFARNKNVKSLILQRCWTQPLFSNQLNKEFDILYRCGPKVWNVNKELREQVLYIGQITETEEERKVYIQSLLPSVTTQICIDSLISIDDQNMKYNIYLYQIGKN